MNEGRRTHIDLFSGIGGFALACEWNGIKTIAFCEIEPNCWEFLRRKYPGIPVHEDVRTFDGKVYAGAWLLTGGVPCQPVSCAGKRRGKEDDRWLWPEAIRVVSEARPDWVIFENPPGIRTLGLDGILSDMEGLGYACGILDIPACAVDSPQIRQRYWIVSHRKSEGCKGADAEGSSPAMRRPAEYAENGNRHLSDTENFQRRTTQKTEKESRQSFARNINWTRREYRLFGDEKWRATKPGVRLLAHGVSRGLLSALGNAIVPQVAAEIIRAIIMSEGLKIE